MTLLDYLLAAFNGGGLGAVIYFAVKAYSARSDAGEAQIKAAVLQEQNAALAQQVAQLAKDGAAKDARIASLETLYAHAALGAPPGPDSRADFVRSAKELSDSVAGSAAPAVPVGAAAEPIGDGLIDPSRE